LGPLSYVIQVLLTACYKAVSKNCMTYTYFCVYNTRLLMMDKNSPKHVEFYSKNIFAKLVHLFGFIIRTYHDARFSECQMWYSLRNLQDYHLIKNYFRDIKMNRILLRFGRSRSTVETKASYRSTL